MQSYSQIKIRQNAVSPSSVQCQAFVGSMLASHRLDVIYLREAVAVLFVGGAWFTENLG